MNTTDKEKFRIDCLEAVKMIRPELPESEQIKLVEEVVSKRFGSDERHEQGLEETADR